VAYGVRNKKAARDPGRGEFVPIRNEPKRRLRFPGRDERDRLLKVIAVRSLHRALLHNPTAKKQS